MKSEIRKVVIDWACVPALRAWYLVFKSGAFICSIFRCSMGMFWCLNRMLDSGRLLLALSSWYMGMSRETATGRHHGGACGSAKDGAQD